MITRGPSRCWGKHILHISIFSIIPSISFIFFYLGGWLLITQFIEGNPSVLVQSNSYRRILPKYTINEHYLLRTGFNQLKQAMGFSQIRFYCFQRTIGRVFHIMTINDSMANEVVKFFYNFQLYASSLWFFLAPSRWQLISGCQLWPIGLR